MWKFCERLLSQATQTGKTSWQRQRNELVLYVRVADGLQRLIPTEDKSTRSALRSRDLSFSLRGRRFDVGQWSNGPTPDEILWL